MTALSEGPTTLLFANGLAGNTDSTDIKSSSGKRSPVIANWVRELGPRLNELRGEIPIDFLLGWIDVESNGHIDTVTNLDERGYFQLSPDESKDLGVDHRRLSVDREYSLMEGLDLVRHYSTVAVGQGFNSGTDLHWHIVKLNHSMGESNVRALLSEIRASGDPLKSWKSVKDYAVAHRAKLLKTLHGHDPTKWVALVDTVFARGVILAGDLPALPIVAFPKAAERKTDLGRSTSGQDQGQQQPEAGKAVISTTAQANQHSSPAAEAAKSDTGASNNGAKPTPTPAPACEKTLHDLRQDKDNILETSARESAAVPFGIFGMPETATPRLCWLTRSQADAHTPCDSVKTRSAEVAGFSVGYCTNKQLHILQQSATSSEIKQADSVVLVYDPQGRGPRIERATLRVEWPKTTPTKSPEAKPQPQEPDGASGKPKATPQGTSAPEALSGTPSPTPPATPASEDLESVLFAVVGDAGPPEDPRFKLSLYGGVNYLYSQNNFSDSFPELRLLVETRIWECAEAKRLKGECGNSDWQRWFAEHLGYPSLRSYGDVGLTSTAAAPASSASSSPSGTSTGSTFQGAKVFDAAGGLGLGAQWSVASEDKPGLTRSYSLRFIYRFGVTTIEKKTGNDLGSVPFKDFWGLRFENESGPFRAGYVELGLGRTDQFIYQTSKRLKADLFAPFASPGAYRLAGRIQVDVPSPFHSPNEHIMCPAEFIDTKMACDSSSSDPQFYSVGRSKALARAGQIKISLFLDIDILEVFKRLGAPTSTASSNSP